MVRKLMLAIVAVMSIAQISAAKKEKTIVVNDTLITDAKYNFNLVVSKNWKIKGFNEPSVERIYLQKKNYSVNPQIKTFGGDYTIPSIAIYAQEFNGMPEDFESLLRASLEEHRSDNEIVQKMGLLKDSEYVTSNEVTIDSMQARQIILKRSYKRLLAESAYGGSTDPSKQTEKFINDHEVHELYVIKKDKILFVFQAFCEREFYRMENEPEFKTIAESINF